MALKVSLSAHARVKLKERKLSIRIVSKVLAAPQLEYYDIALGAHISIARVQQFGEAIHLVVVYRRNGDRFHVVTAYPVKDISSETQRKLKGGRWMPTAAEGHR